MSALSFLLDPVVPQLGRELDKQVADIPVRRGGGRAKIPRGSLQGFRPGHCFTAHSSAPVVEYFRLKD